MNDMTIYANGFISHFSIALDNPAAVYFAGQEVSGCVHLHVNRTIQCRGLFIQIKGDCNVHWTEKSTGYKTEPRHFRNYQLCFSWNHFFLGNPRCISTITPGAHEYEFRYRLPRKIPSSFEGYHGNIRYFCMVQLDWPGGNHFHQKLQCITVNSLFDLNQNPDTMSADEKRTEYSQLLLRSSLKITLSVPRRGFVPGQTIKAWATVDNKTMRSVIRSKTELVEICRYQACQQERRTKRIVTSCRRGAVSRGTKDTWLIQLDIPPIPPSGLVYCDIIHLEYYIKLSVESRRIPKQKVQVPLIIGTVPLEDDFAEFSRTDEEDSLPDSLQKTYGRRTPSVTFAESVWGGTELSTNQRRVSQAGNSFTPTYVLYQRNNSRTSNKLVNSAKYSCDIMREENEGT